MKFVFFGTRELGAFVLEHLLKAGYTPSLVVTGPDRRAGRKQEFLSSPVKRMAKEHNLPLTQPEKSAELLSRPELKTAELFVLAAYGNILSKELVEMPPKGVLNVHPSLLPKYRGPSPERGALLNGDAKTGVTVMLMDEQVDHGPILAQEEFVIPKDITHEELHVKLGEIGGELLVKTIPAWIQGKIVSTKQDHSKATYTKKLSREDGEIDWSQPPEYIERQVRAFTRWPGAFTFWKGKRVKILKTHIKEGKLVIDELQLEGKKPTSLREFLLGHKDFLESILD